VVNIKRTLLGTTTFRLWTYQLTMQAHESRKFHMGWTIRLQRHSERITKKRYTAEPGYNNFGLSDTSSITSRILWYQLIPHC